LVIYIIMLAIGFLLCTGLNMNRIIIENHLFLETQPLWFEKYKNHSN